MRWRENFWDRIGEALKFMAGGGVLISSILGSLFLIWFVAKLLLHLRGLLDRVLFDQPW